MEKVKTKKSKFLVILIVFMLLFSNFGYTIAAIATSEEFEVITKGFFQKDEIKFKSYFIDEKGNKTDKITENVNGKVKLVVEVLPQVEGYLKSATLRAVSSDDDNINFKFTSVTENLLKESLTNLNSALVSDEKDAENNELSDVLIPDENAIPEEPTNSVEESTVANSTETNTASENTVANSTEANTVSEITNTIKENSLLDALVGEETNSGSLNPLTTATSAIGGNTSSEDSKNKEEGESNPLLDALSNGDVTNTIVEAPTTPVEDKADETEASVQEPEVMEEDILIDEDATIEEISERFRIEEEFRNAILDIKLVSENEISLSNIIGDTKFEIELEYNQGEKFNVADLYKNIKLQLSGTYINRDLEEVPVGKEEKLTVGWEYTKDITLESEYTKISPFQLEEVKGTIVENKITVTRDIQDEKYLPVKSTRLEIVAPKVNGKNPIAADVIANKLLATKGEDYGNVIFEETNWKYDDLNGTINVFVENYNNVYSSGSDVYVIIYRYEDYIDSENSNLSNNIKVTITEYSGKENNTIIKEIKDSQDVKVDVGELVTYSIGTNEEKINKAKIYANYNSEVPMYETLFKNEVNVNILTSDVLQQLKIDCTKDVYKDATGVELEAQGIEYKEIKFNYSDISLLLSDGGEIVITNSANETIHVLNKDVITKEEDCTINLNGANGIYLYANNVLKNGNLNFELTKAIKNCNFGKSIFKSITQIESRISAEVKYTNIEDRIALQTISATKDFEESKTEATLSINRDSLSTLRLNENVELKIELNNDRETSDLYVNPSFEIVFPKYVTGVSIESINLLNECGLRVGDFETYTESDIVKVRIDLTGTQTMFSENTITNGTNIIINANIKVDEYTPAKQDQIKLYYCNEGVATYQAQTKWAIKKNIPNGILKSTNGFDVQTIKYQAPTGLIAINGIVNYDGNLSEVRSVKQGAVLKEIPINSSSRIATMELLAFNNTENKYSDVVLIGRIPLKGVKDVITNEDLGATTDVKMIDKIKEDIQNGNTTEIYYSQNENANKDLEDSSNGWTTTAEDLATVKSYMIVIKGDVESGSGLRFTYDFEIPENLPYEAKIAGSFGTYYNNNESYAIVYESSVADTVGLVTEKGPSLNAVLKSSIPDGEKVGSDQIIDYTVEVSNTGSVTANNLEIKVDIPDYTSLYERPEQCPYAYDYGYISSNDREYIDTINELLPGEVYKSTFRLKTDIKPILDNYAHGKDENGYYINVVVETEEEYEEHEEHEGHEECEEEHDYVETYEKKYITEVPEQYIVCKAKVSSSLLADEIETNEIKNELVYSNFSINSNINFETADNYLFYGIERNYTCTYRNISANDLDNVRVALDVGNIYEFVSAELDGNEIDGSLDKETGKIYVDVGEAKKEEVHKLIIKVKTKLITNDSEEHQCHFEIYTKDGIKEEGINMYAYVYRERITAEDMTFTVPNKINEDDEIIISTKVINRGKIDAADVLMISNVNKEVVNVENVICGNQYLNTGDESTNTFTNSLPIVKANDSITIDIILKAKNLEGTNDSVFTLYRTIQAPNQDDIEIEPITIEVKNDKKTTEEKEDERVKKELEDKNINTNDGPKTSTDVKNEYENQTHSKDETTMNNSNNAESNNSSNNSESNNPSNNAASNTNSADSTESKNENNSTNNKNNSTNNEDKKYSISGKVWLDKNKNGIQEDDEEILNGIVNVYLFNSNNKMLKSTSTTSNGYKFEELEKGKYTVAFVFDKDIYDVTLYKAKDSDDARTSKAIGSNLDDICAITNEIIVEDDVNNINIGLISKEKLDFTINKYISNVIVTTEKNEKSYDFDDLELAKVEIRSKELNNATVKFKYKIVIENVGDVKGQVKNIIDYIPEEMNFDEKENQNWFLGNDGLLYNKNLNNVVLEPGEKKEINLSLTKRITEENTGVISNKAVLMEVYNSDNLSENKENNTSIQNTFVLISTGANIQIIILIIVIFIILCIIYFKNRKKIIIKKMYK